MADVERGQLILVTALAIAVSLVALVLLLNTVIYAENLATRGADVGGQDAVEYRSAVVRGVGGVIDAANEQAYGSHAAVNESVLAGVDRVDTLLAYQHLPRAELVEVSNASLTTGAFLAHSNDTGTFESTTGASSWTLANDVDATRNFEFTLNDSEVTASDTDHAFQVVLEDGDSDRWTAYVYDDGGITVAVENESVGSPGIVCSTTDSNPRLDLTAGTLAGESCPGLTFGEDVDDPYSIEYVNADNASGTYELTVLADPDADGAIQNNFDGPASDTAPYYGYAVYNATVDVRYHTNALRFTDRVRVAPGETA